MTRIAIALALLSGGFALAAAAQDRQPTAAPVLVPPEVHAFYLSKIPKGVFTEDEKRRMLFYDHQFMPPSYQFEGGAHAPSYNISQQAVDRGGPEPHGNANREFPWVTGGLDHSPNAATFKALILPRRGDRLQPVEVWTQPLPRTHGRGQGFDGGVYYTSTLEPHPVMLGRYPVGTKAVEVLLLDEGQNAGTWHGWHVFEVRVLHKTGDGDVFDVASNWQPRWYRPVRDYKDLFRLTKGMAYGAALKRHYAEGLEAERLADRHERMVLDTTALVDELPPIPAGLLRQLLNREFVEVTDVPWVTGADGGVAYAGRGGIFPVAYQGSHFNSAQCLACHSTVAKHAADFDPFRDWYGRVRGFDGCFSLQLPDPSSVSYSGVPIPPQWNRRLVEAGILVGR